MVKTSQNQSVKKKRNTRGMGSIRPKNGGYEGRITIKVNGKSKQISLFNKDKRIIVKEMIKAMQDSGIEIDVICKIANLSKEEVEKILDGQGDGA